MHTSPILASRLMPGISYLPVSSKFSVVTSTRSVEDNDSGEGGF